MNSLEKALLRYCGELVENTVLEDALCTMSEIVFPSSITIGCMKMQMEEKSDEEMRQGRS